MLIGRGVIGIGVSSISVADSIDSRTTVQTLTGRQESEAVLTDEQDFVQASRSSALIQMIARLDELLIDS